MASHASLALHTRGPTMLQCRGGLPDDVSPKSPTSPISRKSSDRWHMCLRSRYTIFEDEILGEGGTATVYKGLDKETCRNVAVKLYNSAGDSASLESFMQSIRVFTALETGQRAAAEADQDPEEAVPAMRRARTECISQKARQLSKESADSLDSAGIRKYNTDKFLEVFDVRQCFISLLDYSKNDVGEPGLDSQDEVFFLVFELGEESLEDVLVRCSEEQRTLSVNELRDLHWTLVSIVWGLHAAGFVHLDIKPCNIMKFSVDGKTQWKLIDLDGAVPSGSKQRLQGLTFTPEYMPPELAKAFLAAPASPNGGRQSKMKHLAVSRLMDVWSVGMCAMEAIFLQPVLKPFYTEWLESTGSEIKFLQWLSDYDTDPIVSDDMRDHLESLDKDMCDLLEGMLAKDPSKRSSTGECLAHKWFEPITKKFRDKHGGVVARLNGAGNAKTCSLM